MKRREFIAGLGGAAAAVAIGGLLEIGFAYQQHKALLIRIQHDQAEAAAAIIHWLFLPERAVCSPTESTG